LPQACTQRGGLSESGKFRSRGEVVSPQATTWVIVQGPEANDVSKDAAKAKLIMAVLH